MTHVVSINFVLHKSLAFYIQKLFDTMHGVPCMCEVIIEMYCTYLYCYENYISNVILISGTHWPYMD